jgi:hypothetical protein
MLLYWCNIEAETNVINNPFWWSADDKFSIMD